MGRKTSYPQEDQDRIRELWGDPEWTATMIAKEVGRTRNAVLGWATRQGLKKAVPPPKKKLGFTPTTSRKRVTARVGGAKTRIFRERAQPVVHDTGPTDCAVPLEDLERGLCRFPYGDESPFVFCGKAVVSESSWCELHTRVVFKPKPKQGD